MHYVWTQNGPFAPFFLCVENYYYHSHLPISPFHCAKLKKHSSSRSSYEDVQIQSYEDVQSLGPKWPISPNGNCFRKPVH